MRKLLYILFFLQAVVSMAAEAHPFLITVKRNYAPRPERERVVIVLNYGDVEKRLPNVKRKGLAITDLNFGSRVEAHVVHNNKKPVTIVFDFTFTSAEPVYAFSFHSGDQPLQQFTTNTLPDARLSITFLASYSDAIKFHPIGSIADKIIESTMTLYPDPSQLSIIAPGDWSYEYGFFLNGVMQRWDKVRNDQYIKYVKRWADHFIDDHGVIDKDQYRVREYRLDDILPARLFVTLYQISHEEKYRIAAAAFEDHLAHQPKTTDGGYWHKQIYPYQMWLDGIYMSDVFATQYAAAFDKPALFAESIHQIKLIAQHNTDPKTGLLFHGWDESKNKVWADQQTGTSHEFWGRGIGWYLMALIDCLDYIPADYPGRHDVVQIFQDVSKALTKYQDKKTGLWFQVIDKGNAPDNWVETSCSAMFSYAFAKGYHKGLLEKSYYDCAARAFTSLLNDHVYLDESGLLYLDQTVKVATLNPQLSKGDYRYYVGLERRINDYKGLAALLYASMEVATVVDINK